MVVIGLTLPLRSFADAADNWKITSGPLPVDISGESSPAVSGCCVEQRLEMIADPLCWWDWPPPPVGNVPTEAIAGTFRRRSRADDPQSVITSPEFVLKFRQEYQFGTGSQHAVRTAELR
jgi:hypothetical protein